MRRKRATLILLLFFSPLLQFCDTNVWDIVNEELTPLETQEETIFGSGETYSYSAETPIVGVYEAEASIFDDEPSLAYFEFMNDYDNYESGSRASCVAYFVNLNWILRMSYSYDSVSQTITFSTISNYTSFNSNTVINHSPFAKAINQYENIQVDEDGFSCTHSTIDSNSQASTFNFKRLTTAFPSSAQQASTSINVGVAISELAGRTVLAYGSSQMFPDSDTGENDGGSPDAGTGICQLDAEGRGTLYINVPDALFESSASQSIHIMMGDIPTDDYWPENDGPPFVNYAGWVSPNWNGSIDTLPDELVLTFGETASVEANIVLPVSDFDFQ